MDAKIRLSPQKKQIGNGKFLCIKNVLKNEIIITIIIIKIIIIMMIVINQKVLF